MTRPKLSAAFWPAGLTIVAIIVALVYYPGLSGGYVFDDFPNIVDNSSTDLDSLAPLEVLQGALSSGSGPLRRPIAMLSFSIERYLVGLNPFVMKATNVAIHIINAWLIFALVYRLTVVAHRRFRECFVVSPATFALLVALAWALAPINLTGVLYIVQRMESLASLAMLGGLLAYLHRRAKLAAGIAGSLRWMWAGIGGGLAIGVLCKESAVMLPVYAALLEWIFFQFGTPRSSERQAVLELFGLLLVVPAIAGLAYIAPSVLGPDAYASREFTLSERLWTQARVIWHYLAWTLIPTTESLSLYHDGFVVSRGPLSPWTTLPAALGLAGLLAGAFVLRRCVPWISCGVLWFFVMHGLVSTVLPLELVHEHRNYLGSMGLLTALLAGVLDRRIHNLNVARGSAIIGLVAFFTFVTAVRSYQWGDPLRHARIEAEERPSSTRARYEYARLLLRVSDGRGSAGFEKGIAILEKLAADNPGNISPWVSLIIAHTANDLPVRASLWDDMINDLTTRPLGASDFSALRTLVDARVEDDIELPHERLLDVINAALQRRPASSKLITLKARVLLNGSDDYARVYELLKEATLAAPEGPYVWRNLITHQVKRGHERQARASIDRLQELNRFGAHTAFIKRNKAELAEGASP
jgi:hypothetical protein